MNRMNRSALQPNLSLSFFLLFLVVLMFAPTGHCSQAAAQEGKSLDQLRAKWKELNVKMAELEAEINKDPKPANRLAYRELIDEANRLVDRMESAAKGKLKSDRTSSLATRMLMGIALDSASKDLDAKVLEIGDFLISKGVNEQYFVIAAKSERLSISQRHLFDELMLRHAEAMANDLPRVLLKTSRGEIVLELFENEAPGTVGNFVSLVEKGYYDNQLFHRVIEEFMAQSGGYRQEGEKEVGGKGPGYEIKCECYTPDARRHFTGSLSMAKKEDIRDSGGSEFFVALKRTEYLDGEHTVFGRVIKGLDVFENIERTHQTDKYGRDVPIEGVLKDKIISAKVLRARDHEYAPVKAKRKETPESSNENGSGIELNAPEEIDSTETESGGSEPEINSPDAPESNEEESSESGEGSGGQ